MNTPQLVRERRPTPNEYIFALIRSFPCLAIKLRPWLDRATAFDADEFHSLFDCASTGEIHCAHFVLNVWNPGYAESKGWIFELFAFLGCADDGNRRALINWIARPYWP